MTLCYSHNVVVGLFLMHPGISVRGPTNSTQSFNSKTDVWTFGYMRYIYCNFLLEWFLRCISHPSTHAIVMMFFSRTSLHACVCLSHVLSYATPPCQVQQVHQDLQERKERKERQATEALDVIGTKCTQSYSKNSKTFIAHSTLAPSGRLENHTRHQK